MFELHHCPSSAAMAPHLLLEELGVPFTLTPVDPAQKAHKTPAYLALNPNGLIPVLVDRRHGGELVLYETAAICLHLVDTHPQAALAPPLGSAARAHFYKWLVWLTNTLQATLIVYFYPERWADDAAAIAQVQAHAQARVAPLLDQIDAELARHGGPWLLGAHFSAVDAYAFMLCRWTRRFDRPARSLPALASYLERCLARPAFPAVMVREGLVAPYV